jgi:hypothetical protein
MKITKEWLKENRACLEGEKWFANQNETDAKKVILDLLAQDHFDWANWTGCLTYHYKAKAPAKPIKARFFVGGEK